MLLEKRERVGALLLGHPRPMAELDQRHERRQESLDLAQLVERLGRLLDARMELQQHAAQLPRRLERRQRLAELAYARSRESVSSCPVISFDAFAWKTNPAGVRSAQRADVSGVGRR